ncbi:MAG: hypothetical protein AAGG48_14955 [Planctomycetota bacterium]
MNPYSAPIEVSEPSQNLASPKRGNWMIWLFAGFVLILVWPPLIKSATHSGLVSPELFAAIALFSGVGCLIRALETSRISPPS